MSALILGRALQGLGGGGLTSTSMVVLGDVAPPKERAKYYFYFSITYTTAGALAPALGGALADYVHWSAIFWLNIPLGLAAITITLSALRNLPRHDRPHRLDLVGAALIVVATVAFMLALTSGGVRVAWSSPTIIGLFAAAALIGAAFVARLLTAPEPLIPLNILTNGVARCSITANACGWGAIIALNIYLPVYLQDVLRMSATSAGLSLMVLMGVLNASAGFVSPLIARHRRYKIVPLLGLAAAAICVAVLAWQADHINVWTFEILLTIIGIGFGPTAPLTGVTLQNAVAVHQFGTAVGTMNFLRSLFATVLVAIFGAITLKSVATAGSVVAFQIVFIVAAASLTVAAIAMLLLEERPLNTTHTR
jgi:MFS family permease